MAHVRLGCGDYRVLILERGGETIVDELPWSTVNYGRVLDDMSAGTVTIGEVGMGDDRCCATLADLEAWRHEVAIYRDDEQVWVGPVIDVDYSTSTTTISARDLFAWFEMRILLEDRSFSDADLAYIFDNLATYALGRDNSPNIIVSTHETGITAQRTMLGTEARRIADEMRELGRTGLDFTAYNRLLLCGGIEIALPEVLNVWESAIKRATVTRRGSEAATEVIVTGQAFNEVGDPLIAVVGDVSPIYGLLQAHFAEGAIEDGESLSQQARGRLDMYQVPPLYANVVFSDDAPFGMSDLIPGVKADAKFQCGCLTVAQEMRLQAVNVTAVAGQNATEDVVGTLIPVGREELGV